MKDYHWVHSIGKPYRDKEVNLVCNFDVNVLTLPKGEVERDLSQDVSSCSRLFVRSRQVNVRAHIKNKPFDLFLILILKRDL